MSTQLPTSAPPRRSKALALCAVLSAHAVLFAHATAAAEPETLAERLRKLGYTEGETIDRVHHYRIDGWNYVDDKHIMIYGGPSQRFLITTMITCSDLSSAENIGFTSTASYITKFDKLIVKGAGGIPQQCPITEIKSLSKISDR